MSNNDITGQFRQPDPEPIHDGHGGELVPRYTEREPGDGTDRDDCDSESSTESIHVTFNNEMHMKGHGNVLHLPDVPTITGNVLEFALRNVSYNNVGRHSRTTITINANVSLSGNHNVATRDPQRIREVGRMRLHFNASTSNAAASTLSTGQVVGGTPNRLHSTGSSPQVRANQQRPQAPASRTPQQPASRQ